LRWPGSKLKMVTRSTSTGASVENTPARTHRESVVQSVPEFDEGRGGVVLETVDLSEK
jgi:hypothetical protein